MPPIHNRKPVFVENMANHLLGKQDSTSSSPCIGKNWMSNLIKYHTELKYCYFKYYNHK
ncbi:hypothetical protein CISG_10128 [Coccidioides immitis RMSCC 3703]|uniref:Uncharacterized protein n=1 Tax=Coccidioides immitis RMSCC 3703 TaxID=454286 RepID=A0A0J8QMN4_COCIT|nr:hypothetical protein CISG_10128 [Coccidioides immitis RMSCC 3703]